MSGFNINTHIKHHADFYWNNNNVFENQEEVEEFFKKAKKDKDYKQFILSFNLLDFKDQEEASKVLIKIAEKLLNTTITKKEKNGKTKTGKQKWRVRTIVFRDQIFIVAIHLKGADNSWLVNPHIHILHKSNARFGKNYTYLKQVILEILKELRVKAKPSFASKNPQEMRISKQFKKVLQSRSWAIRMGKNVNIKTSKNLEEDLVIYLSKTKNIEFVLKNYKMLILKGYYPSKLIKTIDNFIKNKENLNKIIELIKKQKIAEKEGIDNLINFYLNTKNLDAIKLHNFTYQEQLLLQVYNKFIPLQQKGFYVKVYKNKKIEIKNIKAGIKIEDRGDKIVSNYTQNIKSLKLKVKLMLDIVEAKGWELQDIEVKGSKEFRAEVEKQIKERLIKKEQEEQLLKQKNNLIHKIKAELYNYTTQELKELAEEFKKEGIEVKYTGYFPTIQDFTDSFKSLDVNKLKEIETIVTNTNNSFYFNNKRKF